MPAAGRLDRRVVIERATKSQNAIGEEILTWASWRVVMMGRKDVRADERLRADQELATQTTVFTAHYIVGLRTDDRLIADEQTWDIIGIAELGRRSGLEITATATVV